MPSTIRVRPDDLLPDVATPSTRITVSPDDLVEDRAPAGRQDIALETPPPSTRMSNLARPSVRLERQDPARLLTPLEQEVIAGSPATQAQRPVDPSPSVPPVPPQPLGASFGRGFAAGAVSSAVRPIAAVTRAAYGDATGVEATDAQLATLATPQLNEPDWGWRPDAWASLMGSVAGSVAGFSVMSAGPGGALRAVLMESGVEAANAYADLRKSGVSDREAKMGALASMAANAAWLKITNHPLMERLGGNAFTTALTRMVSEGLQEGGQEVIGNVVQGRPLDEGIVQSAVAGAIAGPLMGGAHDLLARPGLEPTVPQDLQDRLSMADLVRPADAATPSDVQAASSRDRVVEAIRASKQARESSGISNLYQVSPQGASEGAAVVPLLPGSMDASPSTQAQGTAPGSQDEGQLPQLLQRAAAERAADTATVPVLEAVPGEAPSGLPQSETGSVALSDVSPGDAPRLTYDEFKARYTDAFNRAMQYKPSEVGSQHYTNQMAALAEAYPEYEARVLAEAEREALPHKAPAVSETESDAPKADATGQQIPLEDGTPSVETQLTGQPAAEVATRKGPPKSKAATPRPDGQEAHRNIIKLANALDGSDSDARSTGKLNYERMDRALERIRQRSTVDLDGDRFTVSLPEPGSRIVGTLTRNTPATARLEQQDASGAWVESAGVDEPTLLTYVQGLRITVEQAQAASALPSSRTAAEKTDEEIAAEIAAELNADAEGPAMTAAEATAKLRTPPVNEAKRMAPPAVLDQLPDAPQAGVTYTRDQGVVASMNDRGNLELRFKGKPDESVRTSLKQAGYRWSPPQKVWYAKRSDTTWALARTLVAGPAASDSQAETQVTPSAKVVTPQAEAIPGTAVRIPPQTPEEERAHADATVRAFLGIKPDEAKPETLTAGGVEFEVKPLIDPKTARLDNDRAKLLEEKARLIAEVKASLKKTTSGVDPSTLVPMVKLVRVYTELGLTDAQIAWRDFQQDYGEGFAGLRNAFAIAWRKFTGQAVNAADLIDATSEQEQTQDEAATHDRGRPSVPDSPGPAGDTADSGGGTPDAVRAGGADVLGAVSPEVGDGAEAAEPDGTRGGDSEASPSAGVGDVYPDGTVPLDARVAEGGADPVNALSPTGADRDAGPIRLDYQLTPDRIDTISSRGAVTRLTDNLAAIRLVQELARDRRHATADEQDVLAKYVGWGATDLQAYLGESPQYGWSSNEKRLWQELRDLTTEEQRKALVGSTLNAHYTYGLYRAIWSALEHFGFRGGRVLEPAVGTGHAFGLMPEAIRNASTLSAVELDPLTAAIAQQLYPSAKVQAIGYQAARIPLASQDLIISNVPFAKHAVRDPLFAGKPEWMTKPLHNYFFAKAMDHVRPGGVIAFITSRYTLDAPTHEPLRRYLMEQAHFLGAVRLPRTAFEGAKTEVITDVILLQKRAAGDTTSRNTDAFIKSQAVEALTATVRVRRGRTMQDETVSVKRSTWYTEHPELVLGAESLGGSLYSAKEYTVDAEKDADVPALLERGLKTLLPENGYERATTTATAPSPRVVTDDFKAGEYHVEGTKLVRVNAAGEVEDVTVSGKTKARLVGMVTVRDAVRGTLDALLSPETSEAEVKKAQAALTRTYKAFEKAHGPLNSPSNRRLFRGDPEAARLLALEVVKPRASVVTDTQKAGPPSAKGTLRAKWEVTGLADIFTMSKPRGVGREVTVETPQDALLASLGLHTRIDWPYMAKVSGQTEQALQQALTESRAIFRDPAGGWVLAEEYLSGDVVTKLEQAEAMAADDPQAWADNVAALKAVQPAPKTADQVRVGLGAHWVPIEHFQAFLADELKVSAEHVFIDKQGTSNTETWRIEVPGKKHDLDVDYGYRNEKGELTQTAGTFTMAKLVQAAFKHEIPTVTWTVKDSHDKSHTERDAKATVAVRANLDELLTRWQTWIEEHPKVQTELVDLYNQRFNRTVERVFDGSHLELPGLARELNGKPFTLHPHQLRAIWRVLASGNTLLAHDVGAGKTFEMIVSAMEMRRTGRARKPLITVPTNLLGQWRQDILRAYPQAKVLAFDESDLSADKRQAAMSRIAFGDWDIVLVPHSSFGLLQVNPKTKADMLQQWVDELVAANVDEDARPKEVARLIKKFEDKIHKLLESVNDSQADSAIWWEQMGVDALFVDEAHLFKNLYFHTNFERLRGLSRSEAERALDLFIKVRQINEASGYRNLVLATATPVMNSVAEIFTMQRYLQPHRLRELGLDQFDRWYEMFARALPTTEQLPNGEYQEVQRLRAFKNLRTLRTLVGETMDVVRRKDMPYLDLPKLKGGSIIVRKVPTPSIYPKLKAWFTARLDALKEKPPYYNRQKKQFIAPDRPDALTGAPTGRHDLMIAVMTDGKLAAVDPRLILGNRVPPDAVNRLTMVADDMVDVLTREKKDRGAVLGFLDVGTPRNPGTLPFLSGVAVEKTGEALGSEEDEEIDDEAETAPVEAAPVDAFDLYAELRRQLIARGVKPDEIAFIHEAQSATERLALFDAVNEGRVRVMLASTDRGGVGMNVQTRLKALFHIDAPRQMRPGDLAQREGRIIRQGNGYKEIEIYRYVTEGTTDEWLYGVLGTKSGFINAFYDGETDEFIDVDPSTLSIEEAQAIATGNPLARELITTRTALTRLEAQASAAIRNQARAKADIASWEGTVRHTEHAIAVLEQHLQAHPPLKGDDFTITVDGRTYAKRGEASAAMVSLLMPLAEVGQSNNWRLISAAKPVEVATFQGVTILGALQSDGQTIDLKLAGPDGSTREVTSIEVPKSWDKNAGPFGEGRQVAMSVQQSYAKLVDDLDFKKSILPKYRAHLEDARATAEQEQPVIRRAREAKQRVEELETLLKEQAATEQKSRSEERAQRKAATPKATDAAPSSGGAVQDSVGSYGKVGQGRTTGTRPPTSGTGGTVRPLATPELVELAEALQRRPSIVKGFRKVGKTGEFRGPGGIRLAASLFRRDRLTDLTATLAHEIGHLVDWLPDMDLRRGNLLGRLHTLRRFLKHSFTGAGGTIKLAEVRTELIALSDQWRPWNPEEMPESYRKYRHSGSELYADGLSALLNDPGWVEEQAPTFYRTFFAELGRKPDVQAAYDELQTLLGASPEALTAHRRERVRGMIDTTDARAMAAQAAKQVSLRERAGDWWAAARHQFLDKHTTVRDKVAELEKRGTRLPEHENPVYLLEERGELAGKRRAWVQRYVDPVKRTLDAAGIDWTTFGEALFYERILGGDLSANKPDEAMQALLEKRAGGDRADVANPLGITPDVAQRLHADMRQEIGETLWPVLQSQLAAFRTGVKAALEEAYEAGLYADDLYRQMRDNKTYATFRVADAVERDVTSTVYKQVGTFKDIQNPADATILKTLVTIGAAAHNRARAAVLTMMDRDFPESIQPAKTKWDGHRQAPVDPEDRTLRLQTFKVKGQIEGRYVDVYTAESLDNALVGQMNIVVRALALANRHYFRPVFTTLNLGFQVFNVVRDFLRFYKNMPGMSLVRSVRRYWEAIPIAKVRAFGLSAKPSRAELLAWEDLMQAEEHGLLSTMTASLMHRDLEDTQIDEIRAAAGLDVKKGPPTTARAKAHAVAAAVLSQMGKVSEFIEALPKAAAIQEFRRGGAVKDIGHAERSHIRRRVGSPDFKAGGTWTPVSNNLFLFSNAILQGWRSDLEVATDPTTRFGWWMKTALVNFLPKAIMAAALAGWLDDEDEEEGSGFWARAMRGVSEYDRTNYTIIPLSLDEQGKTIYLRLPQDDTGRFIGGLFWKALSAGLKDEDEGVTTFLRHVADYTAGQVPSVMPAVDLLGATGQLAQGRNPYDAFRGRYVFTDEEWKAWQGGDWTQLKKFTGWVFQQAGGGLLWKFVPGERVTPERSDVQWLVDLPIASNILGRVLKVSDYGAAEELREAGAQVDNETAARRQRERRAVTRALSDWGEGEHGSGARWAKARDLAETLYPNSPKDERAQAAARLEKRLRVGEIRMGDDAAINAILAASSNAEKMAIARKAKRRMSATEWGGWLEKARRADVLSAEVWRAVNGPPPTGD